MESSEPPTLVYNFKAKNRSKEIHSNQINKQSKKFPKRNGFSFPAPISLIKLQCQIKARPFWKQSKASWRKLLIYAKRFLTVSQYNLQAVMTKASNSFGEKGYYKMKHHLIFLTFCAVQFSSFPLISNWKVFEPTHRILSERLHWSLDAGTPL